MKQNQQNNRRNRHNNNRRNNNKTQNILTKNFDSNGPDVKIRGNASTIAEKYMSLAHDAISSGSRINAENYFQHAEHYKRIITIATLQQAEQRAVHEAKQLIRTEQKELSNEILTKNNNQSKSILTKENINKNISNITNNKSINKITNNELSQINTNIEIKSTEKNKKIRSKHKHIIKKNLSPIEANESLNNNSFNLKNISKKAINKISLIKSYKTKNKIKNENTLINKK